MTCVIDLEKEIHRILQSSSKLRNYNSELRDKYIKQEENFDQERKRWDQDRKKWSKKLGGGLIPRSRNYALMIWNLLMRLDVYRLKMLAKKSLLRNPMLSMIQN